jgi:CBS domain-containing protein
MGWGLVGFGIFQLLTGNFVGGLWLAFIGWFLASAADASRREMIMRQHFRGVKVRDLMDSSVEAIDPETSVEELVQDIIRQRHRRAAPVIEDGRVVGIITVTDLKDLAQDKWGETPVKQLMTRDPLYSVGPEEDMNSAIRLITRHDINQLLVLENGRLEGILNRADVIGHLQLSQDLGLKSMNELGWKS